MENSDLQALHSSMAMLSSSSSMAKPLDEEFKLNYDNFPRFNPRIIRIGEKSEQFPTKIGGSTSEVRVIKTELPGGGANNVKWLVDVKNSNSERAELVNVPETATIGVLGKGVYAINYEDASEKGKSKVKIPAHIPMIPKPQDVYQIRVNNSNQPFNHIWLQSGDGTRFVHPLESLSAGEFYSQSFIRSNSNVPIRYVPIESTQFTYVDDVQHLKALVAVLHNVNEFAVDLEHNHYRSFQGMTCLMQISTRTEDFIVDTLKLWVYIGPYLRDFFKDPRKRKVMHGADKDILWLQRDFGIYVCNLFDTGQAARVLNMERHSLEHLLRHYCNVSANKEYQTADWRLRPIPEEMLRYAREDTHYLLYIYDMMRMELIKLAGEPGHYNLPLLEVYTRSYDICLQLYTKEVLTSSSYLNIFGLQDAGLNAQQLAVVAGLCEWRDMVARVEDESTGYILPNKTLIQIGKEMPVSTSKLWQLVKTKHPVVSRNMDTIVSIIRHSMLKADSYQSAVEHLNLRRMELEHGEHQVNISGIEMLPSDSSTYIQQRDLLQDPKLLQESGRIIDLPQSHTGGANIEEKGVSTKALSHLSPSFVKYVEPVKENRKTNLSGKLFPVEAI